MPFAPTPAELALTSAIFAQHDPQKFGILSGDVAVKVFGLSKPPLPPSVLGEIWNIADEDNNGFLPRKGVAQALRLMGHAQHGETVTKALLDKPGPLPELSGITPALAPQNTGSGMQMPRSPPPATGSPALITAADRTKFANLFANSKPVNGLLSGEQAQAVFVRSQLPVEKLSQIWNLADTKDRGALDLVDFTIAMYLIQACMSGKLRNVPLTLPPGLYEQAGGSRIIQPQATGPLAAAPLSPAHTGVAAFQRAFPGPAPSTILPWDVTAAEKASADGFFDTLDPQKRGYIEGDVAVPFMLQSQLPEDVLAQVWDLSDINNDGRLTKDCFAVAMHLIQGKLAGRPLPATLPPTLVPPSLRGGQLQSHISAPAPPPPASEPLRDLLWDDTPPQSAVAPQATGGAAVSLGTPTGSSGAPNNTFNPQSFTPHATGSAFQSPQPSHIPSSYGVPNQKPSQDPFGPSFSAAAVKDLLGDDDDDDVLSPAATGAPLQDQSAEIGNTQNQLASTNRSLDSAKAERANLESTLATQAAQLSALQTQLSSARAGLETETKLLETLRARQATQTADINKAREELIRAESELRASRVEKAEVEGGVLRDKEEVRDLQRRMTEVGSDTERIKGEVEKAKKDAKHLKGRLAIARKQLAAKEAERAKTEAEHAETQRELEAATLELKETEVELAKQPEPAIQVPAALPEAAPVETLEISRQDSLGFAASQALPLSPELTGTSTGKRNNPFDRILTSTTASPRAASPFLPFADASAMPTPPTTDSGNTSIIPEPSLAPAVQPAEKNPFDLPLLASEAEAAQATPKPTLATITTNGDAAPHAQSPQTAADSRYGTPPSSTTAPLFDVDSTTAAAPTTAPSVEAAAGHFPAVESQGSKRLPGGFPEDDETDLTSTLKEHEVSESDSDSDDSDEEPLADRRKSLIAENQASAKAPDEPAQDDTPNANANAFDDVFATPAQASFPEASTTKAPEPTAGFSDLSPFDAPTAPPAAKIADIGTPLGGVNDFDEAMNKIPGTTASPAAPALSFDTAFDDNFDFTSAGGAADLAPTPTAAPVTQGGGSAFFPPPPSSSVNGKGSLALSPKRPAQNGFDGAFGGSPSVTGEPHVISPISTQPATKPVSFDDAFAVRTPQAQSPPPSSTAQAALAPAQTSQGANGVSFDDAFGGFDTTPQLKLDDKFGSTTSRGTTATSQTQASTGTATTATSGQTASTEEGRIFPSGSPPQTPLSASGHSTTSSALVRGASPPPSTRRRSSSKEKETHAKDPTARHSKLSLRLPFGRKKKTSAPTAEMPVKGGASSHLLSPPQEEPEGTGTTTPAVEDDVDAVKQLCSMGFSRTQAVEALERQGYDVQRALNSLLGA